MNPRFLVQLLLVAGYVGTINAVVDSYDDLVLTCIPTKDLGNGLVQFGGRLSTLNEVDELENDDNDDDDEQVASKTAMKAVFLRNLKRIGWEWEWGFPLRRRRAVFQAELVQPRTARRQVKEHHTDDYHLLSRYLLSAKDGKPLLCIHGFNVLPESHLEQCLVHKDKFTKFKLIPVIWPSRGGILNYFVDRKYVSKEAGLALKRLIQYADTFPRKSLMAHSMGNRVLRYGADAKLRMDNMFLVAADVNGAMFDTTYIEGHSNDRDEDRRRRDALILKDMLASTKGKIFVLHNNQDYALVGSTLTKGGIPRLGSVTLHPDKVHHDLRDRIVTKNAGEAWLNWTPRFATHGYQFDDQAVAFNESMFYHDE